MKESDLNNKAEDLLNQFETLETIRPSEDWNATLMQKFSQTKPIDSNGFSAAKVSLVAVLFIAINLAFVLFTMNNNTTTTNDRSTELKTIYNELLLPTSHTTYTN